MTMRFVGFSSLVLAGSACLISCDMLPFTIVSPSSGSTVRGTGVNVLLKPVSLRYEATVDGTPLTCPMPIETDARNCFGGGLAEGEHTLVVKASDAAGNTATQTLKFKTDHYLSATITSPSEHQRLSSSNVNVAFTTTGVTGSLRTTCRLDRNPLQPCSSGQPFSNLGDGPHALTLFASDDLDSQSMTVPFFVDTGKGVQPLATTALAAGAYHTCAVLESGRVRCWGDGRRGKLGYGDTENVGEDEYPSTAGDVDVGGSVIQLSLGESHSCAVLNNGTLRCWGSGGGKLGYADSRDIGDNETPASAGNVNVGGIVNVVAAGSAHTCARLNTAKVRCWGGASAALNGSLGYGSVFPVAVPAFAGDIMLGANADTIVAGRLHTCAQVQSGRVRCWGYGGDGALGYGNTRNIGDNETPASAGDVDVGGFVVQVVAGSRHTCALLSGNKVRCGGSGGDGALGYGNRNNIGDDETPASAGDVNVGGPVNYLYAGGRHTCAELTDGRVRCWGQSEGLGYPGRRLPVGDDETPASAGDVNMGGRLKPLYGLVSAVNHSCALYDTGGVRCWGMGFSGELGSGSVAPYSGDVSPALTSDLLLGY